MRALLKKNSKPSSLKEGKEFFSAKQGVPEIKIKIKKDSNIRIDRFLSQKIKLSRSTIKKLFQKKRIKVNEKFERVSYKPRKGDKIVIQLKKERKEKLNFLKKEIIVQETKNYFVVNKPANIVVLPAPGYRGKKESLKDYLLRNFPFLKKIKKGGIVHRLDREASGLLLIAKNNKTFRHLQNLFRERKIKKEYLALVKGNLKGQGAIDLPIGRSKRGYKMTTDPKEMKTKAKEALTLYKVIKNFSDYTLLKIKTKTGRPHQIRVHLASIGYPIEGDKIYSQSKSELKKRIFLHALKIEFPEKNNKIKRYKVKLPLELRKFLTPL